jgi:ABC-type glycerol-3-phosphate transport system substrate-binding protein
MKRILWLVVLILALLLLAGCRESAVPPAEIATATVPAATARPSATPVPTRTRVTPTPTPDPVLQVAEEDLRGVTVRYWHPFTDDSAALMRQLAADFNEQNQWGIRVSVFSQGSSATLQERFTESMQSGEGTPHLVAAPLLLLHDWDAQDWLAPAEPYLRHTQWGWEADMLGGLDAFVLTQHQDADGRQLSMPLSWQANVLFYNQGWAQELGFDEAPATFAAFQEQACAAKDALLADDDRANDGTGGYIASRDADALLSWLAAFGYDDLPVAPGDAYQFATSEGEAAFTALRQMTDEGCTWVSRLPTPYDYFAERLALFYSGSTRDILMQEQAMAFAGNEDDWIVLPYPPADGQSPLLVNGNGAAIVAGSPPEQMAAWLYLNYLLEPRNQALLAIASGGYPVQDGAWTWLEVYANQHPQWGLAPGWETARFSPPLFHNWLVVGNVLADAGWELYQPFTTVERVPGILEFLDTMIAEILQ